MLLEFIADGADECPLLRFYHWRGGEVSLLRDAARRLSEGATRSVEVHRLPFIEALGGITFTWLADPHDRGVLMPRDARTFILQLPPELWADVSDVIEPFEHNVDGFNWLLPVTEVQVLMSWSGAW